jgi:hypothetical protein
MAHLDRNTNRGVGCDARCIDETLYTTLYGAVGLSLRQSHDHVIFRFGDDKGRKNSIGNFL